MSTGSAAIPQLKAAPDLEQIAERLEGGPWAGLELALAPRDVADESTLERAVEATLACDRRCRARADGRSARELAEWRLRLASTG